MSEDLKTKVLIGAVAVALSAPMVATRLWYQRKML